MAFWGLDGMGWDGFERGVGIDGVSGYFYFRKMPGFDFLNQTSFCRTSLLCECHRDLLPKSRFKTLLASRCTHPLLRALKTSPIEE